MILGQPPPQLTHIQAPLPSSQASIAPRMPIQSDVYLFTGNNDRNTEKVNLFASTVKARYVKITPITWKHQIAMRVGLACGPQLKLETNWGPELPPGYTSRLNSHYQYNTGLCTNHELSLIHI